MKHQPVPKRGEVTRAELEKIGQEAMREALARGIEVKVIPQGVGTEELIFSKFRQRHKNKQGQRIKNRGVSIAKVAITS